MALLSREKTGIGQCVDATLVESAFSFMEAFVPGYEKTGKTGMRAGSRLPDAAPNNLYPTRDGAYADFARVPGDRIVPLPDGVSLYEAMALGTSGLTAALAVDRLENAGLTPAMGAVAITGATGGVGSLAVDMFAKRGYKVIAISGKHHLHDFLRSIGADSIVSRETFLENRAPLAPTLFAGALDNVGGEYLDRLAAHMHPYGKRVHHRSCGGRSGRAGTEIGVSRGCSPTPFERGTAMDFSLSEE